MNTWIDELPGPRVNEWIAKNGEAAMKRYHTDDPHFALWLHYLNKVVQRRAMLHFDDLEDWDYWSAYDGDMSPAEAAYIVLEDNGFSNGVDW